MRRVFVDNGQERDVSSGSENAHFAENVPGKLERKSHDTRNPPGIRLRLLNACNELHVARSIRVDALSVLPSHPRLHTVYLKNALADPDSWLGSTSKSPSSTARSLVARKVLSTRHDKTQRRRGTTMAGMNSRLTGLFNGHQIWENVQF